MAAIKSSVKDWGDRLEHLLRHAIFALLHLPGSTLLDVGNLLRHKSVESQQMRNKILEVIENHTARRFWEHSFPKYDKGDFAPAQHKLSKLLVADTVPLMLSQPNSAFSLRQVMDQGMILLVDLSRVGPRVRDTLGGFLLSLIHLTALGRASTAPELRQPFHLYCDEAHRFMIDTMEDLIAETRKYKVGLTLAHQYLGQFESYKTDALSSMGSALVFSVDERDAGHLAKDMCGQVKAEDLVTLKPWHAILRCGNQTARVRALEPLTIPERNFRSEIIEHSRKRYCMPVQAALEAIEHRQNACRPMPSAAPEPLEELVYEQF